MRILFSFLLSIIYLHAVAQECGGYYFLQDNQTVEIAIYNKKGAEQGRQVYTVSNVERNGDEVTGNLVTEMFDKKGKSINKGKSTIKCRNGVVMIDMKMSIPQQQAGQFGETDVKAENIYMEYPPTMNVGDKLKDAEMHLDMETANGMKQSVDMEVFGREVMGKEKVTTPAGTWDCVRIAYNSKMRIKTMGVGIPVNIEATEWFAPGFGVVKTESKHGSTAVIAFK